MAYNSATNSGEAIPRVARPLALIVTLVSACTMASADAARSPPV
jgi:hypothetical protein